ncbi:MarR family transcriptional regulator [candidate division WOR-3 bacterium]|nr:MarR family transcriptional regulator [candidate division WOR-3 bacterium]
MADNETKVIEAFKKADEPLKTGQVAEVTGIDTKEAGKIIKKLAKEGKLISPKRCFYGLP